MLQVLHTPYQQSRLLLFCHEIPAAHCIPFPSLPFPVVVEFPLQYQIAFLAIFAPVPLRLAA